MAMRAVGRTKACIGAVLCCGVIASCTGSGSTIATPGRTLQGGRIVVAAEQWPDCLNPITSCAAVGWLWYMVIQNVEPFAMVIDQSGNYQPSLLITEAPTLPNRDIIENPFTVTYHLNPKAIWADGTPITSADFAFTLDAIEHTKNALPSASYVDIESIETSSPKDVVIHFKKVVAYWRDLFGGAGGGLLERAAFQRQVAQTGHVDLSGEMTDTFPFSGGPWKVKSFDNNHAVLVRNNHYFGHRPYLDQVTFVPRTDQATEIAAIVAGDVSAAWPQAPDTNILAALKKSANVKAVVGEGPYLEGIGFNQSMQPLDDPKVREALMYAIDREAIVNTLVKQNDPNAKVIDCAFLALPTIGPWCKGRAGAPFSRFTYNPALVASILESDGYTKGADGYYQKDGKDLSLPWSVISGNRRRERTQELEIEKARLAGIRLYQQNYPAGEFWDMVYTGKFGLGEAGFIVWSDPSIESTFGCDQFPTKENGYSLGNAVRWCNQEATALMKQADQELDPRKRLALMQQVYGFEASDFVALPLYALPFIGAWRTDRLAGPIGRWNATFYGFFWNMDRWYCVRPGACD
jgi:peptide/nickel transport system substrate-binding protein